MLERERETERERSKLEGPNVFFLFIKKSIKILLTYFIVERKRHFSLQRLKRVKERIYMPCKSMGQMLFFDREHLSLIKVLAIYNELKQEEVSRKNT